MGSYTTEMEAPSTILSSGRREASQAFPAMLTGSITATVTSKVQMTYGGKEEASVSSRVPVKEERVNAQDLEE